MQESKSLDALMILEILVVLAFFDPTISDKKMRRKIEEMQTRAPIMS